MLTEDEIKPGEKYTIELLCSHVYPKVICFESPTGACKFLHKDDLECVSLPPDKPKHDPCRKFRKGDKVRVVEYKGRNYTNVDTGKEGVVSRNETGADPAIEVTFGDDDFWDVDPAYLELVTPVEELEPYFVLDSFNAYNVCKHGGSKFAAICYKDHPLAREHAEKYCAALNAEYRKEQQ